MKAGVIKAKHAAGKSDNISGWLLQQIDLFEKHLRKNKAGDNRSLSFRDLARLIVVNEKEIVRQGTPFSVVSLLRKLLSIRHLSCF